MTHFLNLFKHEINAGKTNDYVKMSNIKQVYPFFIHFVVFSIESLFSTFGLQFFFELPSSLHAIDPAKANVFVIVSNIYTKINLRGKVIKINKYSSLLT